MFNRKILASMALILAVLFLQVGTAAAAAPTQDATPITGTVQSITIQADNSVIVTLANDQGETQTLHLSLQTALALGLVTLDSTTNETSVNESRIGQTVEIDPATVIPSEPEGPVHPIAAILASFFGEDPSIVNGYHEEGFGFGEIAQALWMSSKLGDTSSAGLILQAKESGDYSAFTLPDGSSPANWGQFKKALLEKKNNLGMIVSGHANSPTDEQPQEQPGNGHNNDKNDNGHGHGNDNGNGNGNGNGKGHNK